MILTVDQFIAIDRISNFIHNGFYFAGFPFSFTWEPWKYETCTNSSTAHRVPKWSSVITHMLTSPFSLRGWLPFYLVINNFWYSGFLPINTFISILFSVFCYSFFEGQSSNDSRATVVQVRELKNYSFVWDKEKMQTLACQLSSTFILVWPELNCV